MHFNNLNIIVKTVFGSHLYGTNTAESDTDYKGLFLPTKNECLLNRIPRSYNHTTGGVDKNNKDDIDQEYFSLQYFMRLAQRGEMIVIDLLHTPKNLILDKSKIWDKLYANRSMFYSKNLAGYLGYIRKQTAKYGIKGSRLAAMKSVISAMDTCLMYNDSARLVSVWDDLPINEYCFHAGKDSNCIKMYECCGKKFQATAPLKLVRNTIQKMYSSYGERAKKAERNEGIDWKAVSHAFRAGYQLLEIYKTNDLKYPLKDAEFIKEIKLGKYHYINDSIGKKLEQILCDVECESKKSSLREKINNYELDKFILNCYKGE